MNIIRNSLLICLLISQNAFSEDVFSFYGGFQGSPHSGVSGTDPDGNDFDFTAGWEGQSFKPSPYYGLRFTRWYDDDTGLSFDFTHTKAAANADTIASTGYKTLEFTDGLNTITLNYMHRTALETAGWTRHWGVGAGLVYPHVEFQTNDASARTFEFQLAGYAIEGKVGLEQKMSAQWSILYEYEMSYNTVDADLNGGGNLKTNIITNAINVGMNYRFQ